MDMRKPLYYANMDRLTEFDIDPNQLRFEQRLYFRILQTSIEELKMGFNELATPCLLYCGSCRYNMNDECKGCGTESRPECDINRCCRTEKRLLFCTECADFPCDSLSKSIGVHPDWLKNQATLPPKRLQS